MRPALLAFTAAAVLAHLACSDTPADAPPDAGSEPADAASPGSDAATPPDASVGTDAGLDASTGSDASCAGPIKTGNGESCIGYGASSSCDPSCGQPYGYVCFLAPPPGFTGCRETRTSTLVGNSYCCPTNDCVAQPDLDSQCAGVTGRPKRYQCPPTSDAGWATPPTGCVEHNSGPTNLEKFYCCP